MHKHTSAIITSPTLTLSTLKIATDFMNIDRNPTPEQRHYASSQFVGHLVGTVIHAWCLSVVWRCYCFLGEKKVARQIGQQLSATHHAFQYPDQLLGCAFPVMPPAYAEVVSYAAPPQAPTTLTADQQQAPATIPTSTHDLDTKDEAKQPLNSAE